MKKLLPVFVLSFLVLACDSNLFFNNKNSAIIKWDVPDVLQDNSKEGDSQQFWAQNLMTKRYYQLTAKLLYKGQYCNIWVEQANGISVVTKERAKMMADAYDNKIYNQLKKVFSYDFQHTNGKTYDTMQIADFMGDQDGKLCILLLDIQDGYTNGGGYVSGYFSQINFYDNFYASNKRDMIFVDTYPGNPGTEESNRITAHEMQHLMNFVTSYMFETMGIRRSPMDLWINEGLSSAAEWVATGSHSNGRIAWYNSDPYKTIAKGNNFFVWDNYKSIDSDTVMDDYATVYLFFQWLRLQAGLQAGLETDGTEIFNSIINSKHHDYRAVTEAARIHINSDFGNWDVLLKTWMAANYINALDGLYGYRNEKEFNSIKIHYAPSASKNILLFPGEGVYSFTANTFNIPINSGNVRYLGLNADLNAGFPSFTQTNGVIPQGKTLLTFNANTSAGGDAQSGIVTGYQPSFPQAIISVSNSVQSVLPESYAISAGELRSKPASREPAKDN